VLLAFIDHYLEFLGQQGVTSHLNSTNLFCNKLTSDVANYMVRDVSDQEIREAMFVMGDNKAPGPDGYAAAFLWKLGKFLQLMVISNQMKGSLADLVSLNRLTFVPGRRIYDNILLNQELMHNYHLDRARVIMDTLEEFKEASGLTPSLPKSTAYFCNVLNYIKLNILNILSFKEGNLLVKYLGVPLVPSHLLYRYCKELMEKVKGRIMLAKLGMSKYSDLGTIGVPHLSDASDKLVWKDLSNVDVGFSVAIVWECIRPRFDEVDWYHVVWFSHQIPRHAIHLWLVIKRKLKTQDKLRQWDVVRIMKKTRTPRV
ncbi:reverse transcriptase domain, reverse transcriptase zinc-binding domain protein, partial [Tanacetum coccineum]